MSLNANSTIEQVAAVVSDTLTQAGITAVLSGGAAVQIYTSGMYESKDLDFVAAASNRELERALKSLDFERMHGSRHFLHPTCQYTLEFPTWPLAIGNDVLKEWGERSVGALRIQILTPTQCAMDRLAAFYHWSDRQALDQAVLVASQQTVDIAQIEQWSMREGRGTEFAEFAVRVAAEHK
jgi:hypothetical protein